MIVAVETAAAPADYAFCCLGNFQAVVQEAQRPLHTHCPQVR
jgi:hypothetical protein